mmetsp:Transcript_37088/g.55248  ORF Transcript_37088/g.55248 Transcript_37088/m.55248 type:complete len:89 (-) Transcript_37088:123-389(-)
MFSVGDGSVASKEAFACPKDELDDLASEAIDEGSRGRHDPIEEDSIRLKLLAGLAGMVCMSSSMQSFSSPASVVRSSRRKVGDFGTWP